MRIVSIAAALLAFGGSYVAVPEARAQQTLYVAGYGGFFEQTIRKEIIPAFEQAHKVKVAYITGIPPAHDGETTGAEGNQQIDIAIADDGPMYQAIELGFCGPIKGFPSKTSAVGGPRKTRPSASSLVGTGIVYNTKYFAEKGEGPTSWNDLADQIQELLVPPANNTYGPPTRS
jgi:putative spermidine/putrescine transport system substrate-binding protein